jgi:hypothetical protein|tara:strand:+ start:1068 stop:1178 length:111 start_codon:yes stop_codon:yes gene_type:complete
MRRLINILENSLLVEMLAAVLVFVIPFLIMILGDKI